VTTENWRRKRVSEALRAYEEEKGRLRDTVSIAFRGRQEILRVVELPLDAVLLNSKSHRLRAQLESHQQRKIVQDEPWSEPAQIIVADLLRKAHSDFAALRASLRDERQREAGLITREGVLLNANSRAVALRDLTEETKGRSQQFIRVGVLPSDIDEKEQAQLELQLQVQEDLKADYTLTNELLFVEDLYRNYKMTAEEIATFLRWDKTYKKQAAAEVEQRLAILALLREMQKVPTTPIALTFFDGKLEQLKALEQKYTAMSKENPAGARGYRDSWLCAALGGASSVHDLRLIDDDFIDHFRSHLQEDEIVGDVADELLSMGSESGPSPKGVDLLDPAVTDNQGATGTKRLLELLLSEEGVDVETDDGGVRHFAPDELRAAISIATKSVIGERRAENRSKNRLDEPVALVREAVLKLGTASSKFKRVESDLGRDRRGKLAYHTKRARKALSELEAALGVTPTNGRRR
jgi:hypothetical protein